MANSDMKMYPICPKGKAVALHLTLEFAKGKSMALIGLPHDNPYDFFDEYEKNYAWSIGWQKGKTQLDGK